MHDAKDAASGKQGETVVLPFPGPRESISPATEFRSTWLTSSLEGLRQHGHLDRYLSLLTSHQNEITTCVAGSWISIAVALAHYHACERLRLSPEEIEAMARGGGNVRRAWYANVIASAQRPDTSMWTVLAQLQKFWLRSANGGAVAVFQVGPHSARLHYVGCPLFNVPYFREAFRVVVMLLAQHVHEDVVFTMLPPNRVDEVEYRLHWLKS
jgi:hypothetical protein